jgi:hypothetical protein
MFLESVKIVAANAKIITPQALKRLGDIVMIWSMAVI